MSNPKALRKYFVSCCFALLSTIAFGQVSWSYTASKTADKTYEIRVTATIDAGWHVYSQDTPEGGPLKTSVSFSKNPLVTLSGKLKEKGNLVQKHEEVFDIDVKYYEREVVFIQTIKLKAKAKTNITGTIKYMVCSDERCLPPKKESFEVQLE